MVSIGRRGQNIDLLVSSKYVNDNHKVQRVKVGIEDAKKAVQVGLNKSAIFGVVETPPKKWLRLMSRKVEGPLKVKRFGP